MTRNPADLTLEVTVSFVIIWHGNANTYYCADTTCKILLLLLGVDQPASQLAATSAAI